jgi:tryptophanyl-tRNA synthetase
MKPETQSTFTLEEVSRCSYSYNEATSGPMHLGHLVPFQFTKYLQDALGCFVVIQMADTEKYYFKNLSFEQVGIYMADNIKDIKAMGFDLDKTFIFSNHQHLSTEPMQNIMNLLLKKISVHTLGKTFGFIGEDTTESYRGVNLGQLYSCVCQMAPCFSSIFPKLLGTINCVGLLHIH